MLALSIALGLLAQPPADDPAPPPDPVCLTNACSTAPKPIGEPRTVRDAIAAGQAFKARDLGGTPADAMEAIYTRLRAREVGAPEDQRQMLAEGAKNFRSFGDTSDGSTLAFSDFADASFQGPPGVSVVGSIVKRRPDGSSHYMFLTDNGGGIWVHPDYQPTQRR